MDKTSDFFRIPLLCVLAAVTSLTWCGCGSKNNDPDQAAADGELAMQDGDYDKAAKLFDIAATSELATAPLLYNLGVALDKSGKPKEAADAFRKALVLDSDHIDATEYLAHLIQREGDVKGAAQLFGQVVEMHAKGADRARALNALACAEIDLDRDDMALLHLLHAKRIAPSYAPTYYNLAKLYDKGFHLYPEAADLMERFSGLVTEENPRLSDAMRERDRLRSIPVPPRNTPGNASAAKRLIAQGDDASARSRFTHAGDLYAEALERDPASFEAAFKLARVRYRMRRFSEAESACKKASENAPEVLDPVYLEAQIAYSTGETSKALTILTTRAIPLWPANPLPYQLASYALAKQGRYADVPVYAKAFVDVSRARGEDPAAFVKWVRSFLPAFRAD